MARKLNLGSGKDKVDGFIGIDLLPEADLTRDILRGLPFDDNSVDEIISSNFMEHIPQTEVIFVMNEIWRVLKPGAFAHHIIPQAGSMNFNQDPTHLSHWIPETFRYFQEGHPKNVYYDNIKPWKIIKCDVITEGNTLDVILQKPNS